MIWKFIQQFTKEKILQEKELLELKFEYVLVSEPLKRIIMSSTIKPQTAGLLLGRQFPNGFVPSVALLQMLVPHAERTVTVNDKGAWLFICARDLWSESIIDSKGKPEAGQLVLVCNEHKECLGVGYVVQKISARGLVIKNLYDIGWFARKTVKAIRV